MQSRSGFLLNYVHSFFSVLVLYLKNESWFHILDQIGVSLVVEQKSESLVKSLIDGILDDFDSRFRRCFRDIDGHVGKGILK